MTQGQAGWSLDPAVRLADRAWRRKHSWPVLLAVLTLGIGSVLWFALVSMRHPGHTRWRFWTGLWGIVAAISYVLTDSTFFVAYAWDGSVDVGLTTLMWVLRLVSVVQVVVMNETLLRGHALDEVRREAALLAAGSDRGAGTGRRGANPLYPGASNPTGAHAGAPHGTPSAPTRSTLGPPVAGSGRVLDPGPPGATASAATWLPPAASSRSDPAPARATFPGRKTAPMTAFAAHPESSAPLAAQAAVDPRAALAPDAAPAPTAVPAPAAWEPTPPPPGAGGRRLEF